jgi:hypothetical protein
LARRGTFGRLPRAAPDLTNTIVALVREAQAQVDSNMVDAWQSGGEVDGKGVDDDRLLKHLKMRRDQLSPDDPLWDEWDNRYTQYDFSINESKMALKNEQGKISDQAMADFYTKWAGREDVQKDSEFYRHLLMQGAKWHNAAAQGAAARGRSNKYEAHNRWVDNTYKRQVQGSETAAGYLLAIAIQYRAAPPGSNSLDDINPNSEGYGRFQDVIEDGKADDPTVQGLIDEGLAKIRETEGQDFVWNQGNLDRLFKKGDRGLKLLGDNSMSKSEREGYEKRRGELKYESTRVKQNRANERIQIASDNFAIALDACEGNPYCVREAAVNYRRELGKEAGHVIVGSGSLTAATADPRDAAAMGETMSQLDSFIKGEEIKPPAAAQTAVGTAGGMPAGYTIFDAAKGNDSAEGFLGVMLNDAGNDAKLLDAGGWMTNELVKGPGDVPVLDGDGKPMYQYRVMPADAPPPVGAVEIRGSTVMTDPTRVGVPDPTRPGTSAPHSVAPTVYVQPEDPVVIYQNESGDTVPGEGVVGVAGKTAAPAPLPWKELRGVKDQNGDPRTVYRTGTGTPNDPYMYHNEPPLPAGVKRGAGGLPVLPVKQGTDAQGKPQMQVDTTNFVAAAASARTKLPSGNHQLGTFATPAGAAASQALRDAWSAGGPNARQNAQAVLDKYKQGVNSFANPNDPQWIAATRDVFQVEQTNKLYAQGKVGKAMDDQYGSLNDRTPGQAAMERLLAARGITEGKYGRDEVNRRISLLEGIGGTEKRLADRRDRLDAAAPFAGRFAGAQALGRGQVGERLSREEEQLRKAREDIFNPTISVSNITIPGMPRLMQEPGADGLPVGMAQHAWLGGLGGRPVAQTAPPGPKPFAAPTARYGGQSPDERKPTGPGVAGPTTAPKPPAPPKVPEAVPGQPGKSKDDVYTPPKPAATGSYKPIRGIGGDFVIVNGRKVYL